MTKEINIENIINMNYRVLMLLGIATSIIMDYEDYKTVEGNKKIDWLMKAIQDVVYENKPIPEMPK